MTIDLPVLGLLKEKPMHGYDLKQRLDAILGFTWQPSYGSLYPMLRKLEERGLVTKTPGPRGPGPQKHAYNLTAAGEARLRELLLSEEVGARLHLKILFFDQLSSQERKGILERYRQQRTKTLERLGAKRSRWTESLDKYQRILLDHGLENLRREITWLDSLIRKEDEGDD